MDIWVLSEKLVASKANCCHVIQIPTHGLVPPALEVGSLQPLPPKESPTLLAHPLGFPPYDLAELFVLLGYLYPHVTSLVHTHACC